MSIIKFLSGKSKGQGSVEYILLIGAVVASLVVMSSVYSRITSLSGERLEDATDTVSDQMSAAIISAAGIGNSNLPEIPMTIEELQEAATQKVIEIKDIIMGLPESFFDEDPEERRDELSEKLDKANEKINESDFDGAIAKLNESVRKRVDGCVGGDPDNDWITDCSSQEDLIVLIDESVSYIENASEMESN